MKSSLKTNSKNCSQFLLIKNHGEKALGYVQIIFLCQHVFVTSEWSVEKEKKLCRRGREKSIKKCTSTKWEKRQAEVYENNRESERERENERKRVKKSSTPS
jgi:hypothetical protein